WTGEGTAPDALDQAADQRHVALLADFSAQPQPGLHHHRQRHPDDTALSLDAQLVGLDMAQVLHKIPVFSRDWLKNGEEFHSASGRIDARHTARNCASCRAAQGSVLAVEL